MSVPSPELPRSGSEGSENSEAKSATVCYLCRQRKTKCDKNRPRCGYCVKAKVHCQYVAQPKKRGLRAGYVSELESRLEVVEQDLKRLKRDSALPASPEQSKFSTRTPFSPLDSPFTGADTNASTTNTIPDIYRLTDRGEATAILNEVPLALLHGLVELWFKECQSWCPILQRPKLQESLAGLTAPIERIDDLVLRALVALSFSHSSQAIVFGYKGRRQVSTYLRSEVLVEAMAKVSLESLQALLIIAILDYGNDDIPSTWSLLSMCRRLCEQLGLFRRLLTQMQDQTPGQIGPPAKEAFEGNELALPLTWVTLALDSASTLGASWRDASAALMEHIASIAYTSTPDLNDAFKTTTHLAVIGVQPVHIYLHDQINHTGTQADSGTMAAADEIYHNLISYCHPTQSYTFLSDGSIEFDSNSISTSVLINAAVIILYGRHIDLTNLQGDSTQGLAAERCSKACKDMVRTIRTVSDADTEFSSPLLATRVFVAARYQLALSKHAGLPRPPEFDVLMHALNMCGRRWPLARRLDIVLRAAIVEIDKWHLVTKPVPAIFWDLRQSGLDVDETLKEWVQNYRPCLFVGSLNGPYA